MGRAKYVVELAEEERVRLRSLLRGGNSFRSHGDQGTGPVEGRRRVHGWGDCGRPGGGHCYGGQDSQAPC